MTTLAAAALQRRLERREFTDLFVEELGWDRLRGAAEERLQIDGDAVRLKGLAQKRDVPLYLHSGLPERERRRRIERELSRRQLEHLLVFLDEETGVQVWQWVKREAGRPDRVREHAWRPGQPVEALRQKLDALQFTLEEEDAGRIEVTQVTQRLKRAFDADRVTRRFYTDFKARHDALMAFLKGLPEAQRSWYASVTLNRLMFVWFVQKKGFVAGDPDYLVTKLAESRKRGKDQFFRGLLGPLFFRGFACPKEERSDVDKALLGDVPYLNGGLFQEHQIEREHDDVITLPDQAFADLFAFFGQWTWHLDERDAPLGQNPEERRGAQAGEINPDVLGYIFEKYVNQKQMGAYYTKEDVTEYICANTILPRLLDKVKAAVPVAFRGDGSVWRLLADNPDRYIWPSVQHGLDHGLPAAVAAGVDDVAARKGVWDRPATADLGLPTETWREVAHRRERCKALRARLAAGEIAGPDAMVTANLDIHRFVQDAIGAASEDQLKAWWDALSSLTVLDPACGSGAFLFAALNLLEPVYTQLFDAMRTTVDNADFLAANDRKAIPKSQLDALRMIVEEAARHPSERYFILRQVALNNLYGVDIMEEAAEICKLRLFLKLVAQLDDAERIEPLPDLDFTIRSGNSLVGFASRAQLDAAVGGELDFDRTADRIEEEAEQAALCYRRFKDQQIVANPDAGELRETKAELQRRLAQVADQANRWLATRYGKGPEKPAVYAAWLKSHKPFNWFTEFYDVMHGGGFDAVVGNPPYVQRTKIIDYATVGYETSGTPDIYAQFIERGLHLLDPAAWLGLIVPISFQFSEDFSSARAVTRRGVSQAWLSTFSRNPAALFFAGLGVRNTILVAQRGDEPEPNLYSSRLYRWIEEERPHLFEQVSYLPLPPSLQKSGWARLDNDDLSALFDRIAASGKRLIPANSASSKHALRFKSTALYYLSVFADDPPCFDGRGRKIAQPQLGQITFGSEEARDAGLALALTKLSLLWWAATGDDFHVTSGGLSRQPLSPDILHSTALKALAEYGRRLRLEMAKHVIYTQYAGKKMGNYDIKYLRPLTDEIDQFVLAELGASDVWESVELAHARFMKMTRERHGTTRADLTEEPEAA